MKFGMIIALCTGWAATISLAKTKAPKPSLQVRIVYQQNFEQVSGQSLPAGIHDDSGWAGSSVPMKIVDSGDPRYGHVLQCRISGFAQIFFGNLHVEKGQVYRISMSIASAGPQEVELTLRQKPRPWKSFINDRFDINEEMRRISFIGKADGTADQSGLMLNMTGQTTLRIDNIRIEKLNGELPPGGPPTAGNMILNSSFELGMDGWQGRGAVRTRSNDHAYAGKIVAEVSPQGILSSSWYQFSYQTSYMVRVHLRAVGKPTTARVSMSNLSSSGSQSKHVRISPQDNWLTLAFAWYPKKSTSAYHKYTPYFLSVSCNGPVDASIQVDAVEVIAMEGQSFDEIQAVRYAPHASIERALGTDAPENVFTKGQTIRAWLRTTGPELPVKVVVKDEHGKAYQTLTVTPKGGGATFDLSDLPCGYWHLQTQDISASTTQNGQSIVQGETFIAIVPPMPEVPVGRWSFGAHIPNDRDIRDACWKLGLRWNRLHDVSGITKWWGVEPKAGDWNFDDASMSAMRDDGQDILGMIDGMPRWAKDDSVGAQYLKSHRQVAPLSGQMLKNWLTYANKTTAHWRSQVAAWEVKNEPEIDHLSPEQYVAMLKATAPVIRKNAPNATLIGLGGPLIGSNWMQKAIALGAGRYCDVVSFHGYGASTWSTSAGPQRLIRAVQTVHKNLRQAGTPGIDVWDTETGIQVGSSWTKFFVPDNGAAPLTAARIMPKSVAASLAAGVGRTFYYTASRRDYPDRDFGFSFINDKFGVTQMSSQSMAVAISLLSGRRYKPSTTLGGSAKYVHLQFEGRGQVVHMCWATEGSSRMDVPVNTHEILNIWGRPILLTQSIVLTSEPVYLIVSDH